MLCLLFRAMRIAVKKFLWWVLHFILSSCKVLSILFSLCLGLGCIFSEILLLQEILYWGLERLLWEQTAIESKFVLEWGEVWEDSGNDTWWVYASLPFITSSKSFSSHWVFSDVEVILQLLHLSFGEDGCLTSAQEKKLMLLAGIN